MGTLYYGDYGDKLGSVMRAFMEFLGPNDMMASRLVQLCEKLKPTGSLHLSAVKQTHTY